MCPKDTEDRQGTKSKKITIKADPIVREELSRWKGENETYNDVLKRKLGVLPQDLDELTAFYPPGLEKGVKRLVRYIRDEYDIGFEERVEEAEEGYYTLKFKSTETRHTILRADFHENYFELLYRNTVGDMESLAGVSPKEEDSHTEENFLMGPINKDGELRNVFVVDPSEDLEPRLGEKIEGSYKRWGKKNE